MNRPNQQKDIFTDAQICCQSLLEILGNMRGRWAKQVGKCLTQSNQVLEFLIERTASIQFQELEVPIRKYTAACAALKGCLPTSGSPSWDQKCMGMSLYEVESLLACYTRASHFYVVCYYSAGPILDHTDGLYKELEGITFDLEDVRQMIANSDGPTPQLEPQKAGIEELFKLCKELKRAWDSLALEENDLAPWIWVARKAHDDLCCTVGKFEANAIAADILQKMHHFDQTISCLGKKETTRTDGIEGHIQHYSRLCRVVDKDMQRYLHMPLRNDNLQSWWIASPLPSDLIAQQKLILAMAGILQNERELQDLIYYFQRKFVAK